MRESQDNRLWCCLLQLYPRAWRERHADKMLAILELYPLHWRDVLDLCMGDGKEHLYGSRFMGYLLSSSHGAARAVKHKQPQQIVHTALNGDTTLVLLIRKFLTHDLTP